MKKSVFLLVAFMLILAACSQSSQTGSSTTAPTDSTKPAETAAAGGSPAAGGGAGGEIKVGALFNVTGSMASLDAPSLVAFQMAAEEINANGGVNGKQIKVVSIDTKTDTTASSNGMQELINVHKVVAVGGLSDTAYVVAAGPVAQSAGVPFVTSGATSPLIPDQVGDFMFLAPYGDDAQSFALADFALDKMNGKNAWILTDTSADFTKNISTFFKEQYTKRGGKVVLEDKYDGAADTDFSAQITRLKSLSTQPDVLLVSALPDKAGIVVKQIRDKGIQTPILSADGFDTPALVEMGGVPQTNNVFFSTHVSLENTDPLVQKFVTNYQKKTGKFPENAFAALAYDTMYLIADAIKRAGNEDPKAIRDALTKTKGLKGVTGEISYDTVRVPVKTITIVEVKEGKFKFVESIIPKK